jgi:hypothetical protein
MRARFPCARRGNEIAGETAVDSEIARDSNYKRSGRHAEKRRGAADEASQRAGSSGRANQSPVPSMPGRPWRAAIGPKIAVGQAREHEREEQRRRRRCAVHCRPWLVRDGSIWSAPCWVRGADSPGTEHVGRTWGGRRGGAGPWRGGRWGWWSTGTCPRRRPSIHPSLPLLVSAPARARSPPRFSGGKVIASTPAPRRSRPISRTGQARPGRR